VIDPTPLALDFERDDEPPDWLINGVIERGTVVVLSGDTASGKSLVADALTVAVLKGTEWLGRDAQPGRVVYVDEENHRRLVRDRLAAFGLTNAEAHGLVYYLRQCVCLGDADWNAWLVRTAQEHRADLVVIDTASSTTTGDVNDNSRVAQLYRDALRPATVAGAAVLLLHHERKTRSDEHRQAGQAMMGARQWAGQADGHLAIRATGSLTNEPTDDGRSRQRFPVELETPKHRDGQPPLPQRLVIASERDARNRLTWMALRPERDPLLDKLLSAYVGTEALKRAELAGAVGLDPGGGTFQRLLKAALASGEIEKAGHGCYART
jgi:energy-coupling factor transporter ATP-binding protein EcfA2